MPDHQELPFVSPEPGPAPGGRSADPTLDALLAAVRRTWGFTSLRPLQEEAIQCALDGRDALVVLPTGGGKSLCYQAPALVREGLTVVVSPLISLMVDQVRGLEACGVAAGMLTSVQDESERRSVERALFEQLNRAERSRHVERSAGGWNRQRIEPVRVLAGGFQRLLRSRQHAQPGSSVDRDVRDARHVGCEMLAIVEYQQGAAMDERLGELGERIAFFQLQTRGVHDRRDDSLGTR